jgi:hypothetical protein
MIRPRIRGKVISCIAAAQDVELRLAYEGLPVLPADHEVAGV